MSGTRRAQRLAASEVVTSVVMAPTATVKPLCSTPCGIRGCNMAQREGCDGHVLVLNALRHQRL